MNLKRQFIFSVKRDGVVNSQGGLINRQMNDIICDDL